MTWRLWCDVGPETHGGSLAVRCYHQAVRHFCILGMVAWLSDGQWQEETKHGPEISLVRDNGNYAHWIWWFRVRLGQLCIDSGVWDAGLNYIPIEDTAVF